MIPDKVDILGLEYSVKLKDRVSREDDCNGMIYYDSQEIIIDKHLKKGKQEQVFIHELIHGILEQLGYDDTNNDEHLVQSLAVSLHQIFKQLDFTSIR